MSHTPKQHFDLDRHAEAVQSAAKSIHSNRRKMTLADAEDVVRREL